MTTANHVSDPAQSRTARHDGRGMIKATPVPAFQDNYLWLLSQNGSGQAAVVDPGDAQPVLEELDRRGATLGAILVTHHHADHIGGVRELLARFPEVEIHAPDDPRIAHATHRVVEGDRVRVACLGCTFRVFEVPGHTLTHIAYYGDGKLFCGDTLFACGCGRLFEGSPRQMHDSLSKITVLPDDTEVYCAHEYTLANIAFARQVEPGNEALQQRERDARKLRERHRPTVPSLLALEKRTNPFLRVGEPAVVAAAERYAGRGLTCAEEVFGVVRGWKDVS